MPPASMPRQQYRWARFGDSCKAPFRGCTCARSDCCGMQLLRPSEHCQPHYLSEGRLLGPSSKGLQWDCCPPSMDCQAWEDLDLGPLLI